MSIDKEGLLELKDKIEDAKSNVNLLNGQLQEQMRQIKNEFGCSSLEEGEEKLKLMDISIADFEKRIEKGAKDLEKTIALEGEP